MKSAVFEIFEQKYGQMVHCFNFSICSTKMVVAKLHYYIVHNSRNWGNTETHHKIEQWISNIIKYKSVFSVYMDSYEY